MVTARASSPCPCTTPGDLPPPLAAPPSSQPNAGLLYLMASLSSEGGHGGSRLLWQCPPRQLHGSAAVTFYSHRWLSM